jgi:hypothetical protein
VLGDATLVDVHNVAPDRKHRKADDVNSTKHQARVAGILYLLLALTAPVGLLYVPGKLIVSGNATATADNIRASEWLLRVGIASELVHQIIGVFLVLALYGLFKAVDEMLAKRIIVASIFWGLWLFPFGALVIRSGFIPRIFGVLLMIAGGCLPGELLHHPRRATLRVARFADRVAARGGGTADRFLALDLGCEDATG